VSDGSGTRTLVLLRHGQSTWNLSNQFTGWYDADLTPKGEQEAVTGGELLLAAGIHPDVLHTSLQVRAIRTAQLSLAAMGRAWIPVRRSWRLNERHYGDLQGKDKKAIAEEFGREQLQLWRRSYDVPPPPVARDSEHHPANDPRYAALPPDVLPAAECLKDVLERMLPWWQDVICADLAAGRTVLVAAHGNSLRALVKHLDGIADDEISELNIPTGVPLVYELDEAFQPAEDKEIWDRYLGDVEAIRAAADAVKEQAG
jgi:2,3-bisphosphoglycerate-dependent phosphoglycerate mutase